MNYPRSLGALLFVLATLAPFCRPAGSDEPDVLLDLTAERERAAILRALNGETRAFCRRDVEAWRGYWLHEPATTKTYINFAEDSHTELLGWSAIEAYAKTYVAEHPAPEPAPAPLAEAEIRLYGDGAWVSFRQVDPARGRKRETRLMEKVDGRWRIAGMATVVYGW